MSFFKSPFNWFNKFGTIPESYTEAMSYEEQIMWLCKEIKDNEGFIDEFKKEFEDVSTILQEMQDAINDNIYAITQLQNTKQDTVVAGKGINITKYEFADHPEIATSPLDYNKFLLNGYYVDIHNLEVGDTVDLTAIAGENTSCIVINAQEGDVYDFLGNFDFVKTDESNVITTIEKGIEVSEWNNCLRFYVLHEGKIVVSYWNTDSFTPQVRRFVDTEYLVNEIDTKQNKLIAGEGITITGDTISADSLGFAPFDITSYVTTGSYIDINQAQIGDTISLTPVVGSNTAYYIKEVVTNEKLEIAGKFDLVKIDSDNKVTFKYSAETTPQEPATYESLSTGRVVISFYDTNTNTVKLEQVINAPYVFENIDWNEGIKKLSADVYLTNGNPSTGLINGLYYANDHHVYINNVIENNFNEAFFFVKENIIYMICSSGSYRRGEIYQQYYYDNNEWRFGFMNAITNWSEVMFKPKINNLSEDIVLLDGTGTVSLSNGVYYSNGFKLYINNNEKTEFTNALFLVHDSSFYVIASPSLYHQNYGYMQVYYNTVNNTWTWGYLPITTDWSKITNKPDNLESFSTNEQVIGTWIDGKPLYKKTFQTLVPSITDQYTEIDVTSLNIDELVDMNGLIETSELYIQFPRFEVIQNVQYFTELMYDFSASTKLLCVRNTNSNYANCNTNVTIKYTKTTD